MRKIAESSLNALGQLMLNLPLQRLPTPWALAVCALALRGRAGHPPTLASHRAVVFLALGMDLPCEVTTASCFPVGLRFLSGNSESKCFD